MVRFIWLLLLAGTPQGAAAGQDAATSPQEGPLYETGFEQLESGPFTELEVDGARWLAPGGSAEIDPEHRRSGSSCLHLMGGETSQVTLELEGGDAGALSFWVERWTRRSPFRFSVDTRINGRWSELADLTDEALVGGFLARVRLELPDGTEAIRWECTAPAGTGVLLDDLRIERAGPLRLIGARVERPVLPALVGTESNPLARLVVEVSGNRGSLAVEEVAVDTTGTTDMGDLTGLSLHFLGHEEALDRLLPGGRFTEQNLCGRLSASGETSAFRGSWTLESGLNVFWVACDVAAAADLDHRLQATVSSVRFSNDEVIAPAPPPRGSGQRIGVAVRTAGDGGSKAYRIPGLVTTSAGSLIAVYDIRWSGFGDLPGDIDVGMSRSTDGGRSWEDMRIVMDMGDDPAFRHDGVGDPAVLVDRVNGHIWIAATWSHGNRAWRGSGPGLTPEETGQLVLTRSEDDGVTWSDPINITSEVKQPSWAYLLQGPGRGITTADGTLVFAAQFQAPPDQGRTPHSTILFSKDRGESWTLGSPAKTNTTEAQLVELADGRLMLNMRDNRGGARSVATTDDLGSTWTEHPTSRRALPEPVCMASLIHADRDAGRDLGGWLLFSNPAVETPPRRRMTIKASPDHGASWPSRHHVLVDEGPSAGYSCLTMIDEATVGLFFEGSRAHLTFLRVPLEEIVGGSSR